MSKPRRQRSKATNERYQIETIADFLKIPEDRLGPCLADFVTWLSLARDNRLGKHLATAFEVAESSVQIKPNVFIWFDDGKRGIREVQLLNQGGDVIGVISRDKKR